jgi:hypothetical protein
MKTTLRKFHAFALGLGLAMLAFSGLASADPPSRVARLAYTSGQVSFSPAGDDDWVEARINRPLTTGDRVWADSNSRAEIQVGGAAMRMNGGTDLSILNLDDRIAQMQLTQGALNVRVRRLEPDQQFEIDTPNLAFTVRQPGTYRIEVDPEGNATTIFVRSGQAEVYGEGASYVIDSRQPYRFTGTDLREYQYVNAGPLDDFDRWASERDRMYDNSATARYVSPDVVGYAELDHYGNWQSDPEYGHVWYPTRVRTGWAPYQDGHWVWVDPWGWTWVDDEPWGFAPSHYGRWASRGGRWCWVPGPVQSRAYYAPALVAFIGGSNFQISISTGNVGGVAWFPLAPREVYRPAYSVSRGYFERLNRSNTIVNTTIINNYYNTTNVTNVVYANQRVPGAVVAVPTTTFVQAKPVRKDVIRVAQDNLVSRPVAIAPGVAPSERSVRGAAQQAGKPPAKVIERTVVAREAPPPARAKFADQKERLEAHAGKPLDDNDRKLVKSTPVAGKPAVKVIAKNDESARAKLPPPAQNAQRAEQNGKRDDQDAPRGVPNAKRDEPQNAKRDDDRNKADERREAPGRATADVPRPPKQVTAPAQAARPPERERPDQDARVEQPRKAPEVVAPKTPAPVARPPERERPEQNARGEQPRKAPEVAAPKAPAPVARPPERDRSDPNARAEQPRRLPERAQPDVATPKAPPQAARPPERVNNGNDNGQRERMEQRAQPAPRESRVPLAQVTAPPKPQAPPAPQSQPSQPAPPVPQAPPVQPTPQQPSEGAAPPVRRADPDRRGVELRPGQPKRAQDADDGKGRRARDDKRDDKK